MGHVHYRVRRVRRGRRYRAPATQIRQVTAPPHSQPSATSAPARRAKLGAADGPMSRPGSAAPAFRAAALAKALIIGLLCLQFLAVGRFAGLPFAILLIGCATIAFARHHRRHAFGEQRYHRQGTPPRPTPPRARTRAQASGPRAPRRPAQPPPASPYNLDEYLRRLNNDGA